jgi:hypothetical protein
MDNHRSLNPISDTPIRKVGSQCGIVEASAPRDPVLENLARVFEKMDAERSTLERTTGD